MAEEFKPVTLVKGDKTRRALSPAELVAAQFDGYKVEEPKKASKSTESK